ncbi:DUF4340 domain-containing protein [Reichenbachiella sp. MALMAid0571]|uniref:DUF4340 domain-containing protein n=1 Tax=Reichenbachiella sp. MALMAid0571 TaxID=3143939 RepID=UPI0032E02C80
MKKNTKLTIILVALIVVSVIIALTGKRENHRSFDVNMFAVNDTSAITSVTITGRNYTNELTKTTNGWTLNDQYLADPNMIHIMQSILSQVKVKRPVAKLNHDEIVRNLKEQGRKVSLKYDDGSQWEFVAGGNASKKDAFYMKDDKAYFVEIPGYNNYISGIFELTENQWRDRLLFSSTWRSLKSLEIDYMDENEKLKIYFDNKFLAVEGVNKLDTTALMTYMSQYEYFQINDYLEKGKYPKYDSLCQTTPIAKLTIHDIDLTKDANLRIFPLLKGQNFYLVVGRKEEMMVIDSKRMSNILSEKDQFISK